MGKYYATYKGIDNSEILEFNTAEERNDWVNHKDPFSLLAGVSTTFERERLTDEDVIENALANAIDIYPDDVMPEVNCYIVKQVDPATVRAMLEAELNSWGRIF